MAELTEEQQAALALLEEAGLDVRIEEPYVEPEPTELELLEEAIRAADDFQEWGYKPEVEDNLFKRDTRRYMQGTIDGEVKRIISMIHFEHVLNDDGKVVGAEQGYKDKFEDRRTTIREAGTAEGQDAGMLQIEVKGTYHAINDRGVVR